MSAPLCLACIIVSIVCMLQTDANFIKENWKTKLLSVHITFTKIIKNQCSTVSCPWVLTNVSHAYLTTHYASIPCYVNATMWGNYIIIIWEQVVNEFLKFLVLVNDLSVTE